MSELAPHLFNALSLGAIYALIAVGYSMVYGIVRLINFAHGEVYMAGAMVAWWLTERTWWVGGATVPMIVALPLSMLACAALGVAIDEIADRPLRAKPRIVVLITAIGVSLALQTTAMLLFGASPKSFRSEAVPSFFTTVVFSMGEADILGKEVAIWGAAFAAMIALDLLVHRTRIGRAMRACALDQPTAALMGIDTNAIIAITFAIGSALAAVAGVLHAIKLGGNIDARMGYYPGLIAFAAAVLGGIGSIRGAILGGMVIGVVQALVEGLWSTSHGLTGAFGVMIAVILVRPFGLLGKPEAKRA
jgi:branched-chain amino acid transport system permease protein